MTDIDAMSIVCDLQELQTSIFDNDLYECCASIHCIFNQFFQSMNRRNNDLAGGDFINNILIERLDKAISPGSRITIKALYLDSFGRLRG